MEEGTVLKWLVAVGDEVVAGQSIVEVETDKAVVPYEVDEAGTVLALRAAEGDSVGVGAPILVLGAPGEAVAAIGDAVPDGAVAAGSAEIAGGAAAAGGAGERSAVAAVAADEPFAIAHGRGRVKASPLARRIAARLAVDLATIRGSGPHGRVIRADVERAAAAGAGADGSSGGRNGAETGRATPTAGGAAGRGETTRVAPTALQRTVARRMAESRASVPDIELRVEADMSRAVELRAQLRELAGDAAPSLNDFIVKAAALALREFPRVNGAYGDGGFESYSRVNVGIAVAAPDGLLVPTIYDADRASLGELAATARRLADRARARSLTPEELANATFTVSNLGMFGIDSFSAVINPPQAAILAAGAVKRRPFVLESGELAARETVVLTLACDHRILDGVDGARFLSRVRELLERPLALML
jgi:pyruvate dehydrogenase E2 component (dihydrolipoamide acetyltransferase)